MDKFLEMKDHRTKVSYRRREESRRSIFMD